MIKKLAVSSVLTFIYMGHAYAGGADKASSHHGGGHHETSGGLPQLDPSSFASQTFWLLVIFLLLYVFFSKKSLPEISQTIENRSERIQNDLDTAERLKEEVASVQSSYEESLQSSREESTALFKSIEDDIKKKSETEAKKFQEHSAKKIADLEESINQARDKAMEDMSEVAAEVAAQAAEKIIGVPTDTDSAKAVVKSLNKAA